MKCIFVLLQFSVEVAEQYSEDKARQGGNLGWQTRGQMASHHHHCHHNHYHHQSSSIIIIITIIISIILITGWCIPRHSLLLTGVKLVQTRVHQPPGQDQVRLPHHHGRGQKVIVFWFKDFENVQQNIPSSGSQFCFLLPLHWQCFRLWGETIG